MPSNAAVSSISSLALAEHRLHRSFVGRASLAHSQGCTAAEFLSVLELNQTQDRYFASSASADRYGLNPIEAEADESLAGG
jgi:hypothetical protein